MAITDKLVAIGDAIRSKTNTTDTMTLDEMPSKIANIVSEINPILQDKSITITENGTQTITADSGYDGLNNVEVVTNVAGSGGGRPTVLRVTTPTVDGALNSYTSYTKTLESFGGTWGTPDMAIIIWFARSNCTISNNVTQIYQSEEFTDSSNTKQRLYIGYMEYSPNATITITQTTSARLGLGYIPLCNCGIPTIIDSKYISSSGSTSIQMNSDNYFNIYVMSNIYQMKIAAAKLPTSSLPYGGSDRLAYIASNGTDSERTIQSLSQFYGNIVQVRCPFREV